MLKKLISAIFIGFFILSPVFSINDGVTPRGAVTAQDLYAPSAAAHGGFSTSQLGAPSSAMNPAAGGDAQRIVLDIGYLGLPNFGSGGGFGLGSFNLGGIFPTRYAVFGGSLKFLHSPFDSFPVGTSFHANINAAKELYPGMSVGAGFNFGYNSETSFTYSGDLGFRYNIGNLGPLENFTWAIVMSGLGKSWIPPMLTPRGGVAFDFLRIKGEENKPDPLKVSFAMDLMVPTFQNFAGKVGFSILIAEVVRISTNTQFNVRESIRDSGPSMIPSIGIGAVIKLKSGGRRLMGDMLPSDGELAIDAAAKPLYNGIWAMGGGLTWTVGVVDRNPPVITLDYPEPAWFSPNNDGRADYLEIPITIADERYISEWIFEIRSAENGSDKPGAVVREFRNKELRPENQGIQNIIDRLAAVKVGVEVPSEMRWDGIFESGEVAPDGKYYFTITATDDNGNTSKSGPWEVYVDNTPPRIVLAPFTGDLNIFSPGGGGAKNTITITQLGSVEDLWESGIYNAEGTKIKTFDITEKAPTAVVWDGTNEEGTIVPDGVYTYRISSTDRALNSTEASLENIIVNTIRPEIGLAITDAFFSPNGDGVKDTQIFIPSIPVREGIVNWELQIKDLSGAVRRTISGTSSVPARLEYDGRDEAGRVLPEASYTASLSVRYRNGFTSTAASPGFTLDITPPRAQIRIEDRDQEAGKPAAFSPTGVKNRLVIVQEGSDEISWTGEVRSSGTASGVPVRTFRYNRTPQARQEWDGINNSGALAADGLYTYELFATDPAGNSGRSNIVVFEIDTRDTPISVSTDLRAFSPNADGVRDSINMIPQIQERDGVTGWKIDIQNAGAGGSAPVRSFEGRGAVPASVNWNGRTTAGTVAPDGSYTAKLDVEYRAGNRPSAVSTAFVLDTVPPQAEVSAPYTLFAPNGNGNRDTLPIRAITEDNEEWQAVITGSGNRTVRTWNWTGRAPQVPLLWDGRDEAGNVVPDGTYNFTLSSTDTAGNSTRRNINGIVVDARVPRVFLTASSQAIAPRPNQAEAMRFGVMATPSDGVNTWKLELKNENGAIVKTFPAPGGGTGAIPTSLPWNGAGDSGSIQEGRLTPTLTVNYTKGDVVTASAPPVTVDISGPILGFRSTPEYFSPDNDGVDDELFIHLSARDASAIANWSLEIRETEGTRQLFYKIEGRGSPSERIIWDGRSNRGELVQAATDYEYTYQATDVLGNSSSITGRITTDVLVIRDGDMLRIQVPSITFRANHADFNGIPQDRLDTNVRVLRRIAQILNRFRDYRITVEGHANPVLGTSAEESEQLQPLSLARARMVMDQLVSYGVARNRLSATGRGGTMPVAGARDQDNNWKNRRVEFLLIK